MDLRGIGLGVWIGFDCLRTGTGGGLLWVRWWTFGFLRHGVSLISRRSWGLLVPLLLCRTRNRILFYPHGVLKTLLDDNSRGGGADTSLLSLYMELWVCELKDLFQLRTVADFFSYYIQRLIISKMPILTRTNRHFRIFSFLWTESCGLNSSIQLEQRSNRCTYVCLLKRYDRVPALSGTQLSLSDRASAPTEVSTPTTAHEEPYWLS
jgi:hypothetical protein